MNEELGTLSKVGFGLGHVFNDFCASMWFSYFLVYMNLVIGQSSLQSGILLFFGQFCDAIATPFVGIESDKTFPKIYGNRKSWHLAGTIAVALSFPLIFNPFPLLPNEYRFGTSWSLFFYYMVLVAIFQFGWAIVQLQHMALIPDFSSNQNVRVELNTIRFSTTVVSNVFTYLLCFFILKNTGDQSKNLNQNDSYSFTIITIVILIFGSVLSVLFHILTKEKIKKIEAPVVDDATSILVEDEQEQTTQKVEWRNWLKNLNFYKVTICYMLSRVAVNVSQVYIPLYIVNYLKLTKIIITICPLVSFSSSFIVSFILKKVILKFGSKKPIIFGVILAIITGSWFATIEYFITFQNSDSVQAILASALLGVVGAVLQICSFGLTTELIGDNTESSGFVLGFMSFADKLANGLIVLIVQIIIPVCKGMDDIICTDKISKYYQYTVSAVPVICGILIAVTLAFIRVSKPNTTVKNEEICSCDSDEMMLNL